MDHTAGTMATRVTMEAKRRTTRPVEDMATVRGMDHTNRRER